MWLYIPTSATDPTPWGCASSPSAPEAAGSISDSSWLFPALARSVWWRGRLLPSPIWSRRCARVSWLRRLCGATPEPSTADAGVDRWISSLAASPASRIASPASGAAATTHATSGAHSVAQSSSPAHGAASSKTSPACSRPAGRSGFGETYADWVLRLRADSSARRRLARRTSASGCSSSRSIAADWPTPRASENDETVESWQARRARTPAARRSGSGGSLQIAIRRWPTPTAQDSKNDAGPSQFDRNTPPLNVASVQWATPRASDGEKGGPNQAFGAGGTPLPAMAAQWRTPRAMEAGAYQYSRGNRDAPTPTLDGQARQWATPSVADVTGGRMTRSGPRSDEALIKGQARVLAHGLSSRPDPATSPDGDASSPPRRSLNPLFVEWLMGWPPGWTRLASTNSACSATALCRWRQDMRCALSGMPMPRAEMSVQTSLF